MIAKAIIVNKRTDYDIKNYQSVLPVKHMMLLIKTTITSLLNISTFKTTVILHVKINSYTLRVELHNFRGDRH
jgi:N-glycosylase/DNA lyase